MLTFVSLSHSLTYKHNIQHKLEVETQLEEEKMKIEQVKDYLEKMNAVLEKKLKQIGEQSKSRYV